LVAGPLARILGPVRSHTIYIPGEENTVANKLSRLPDSMDDIEPTPAAAMLTITTNAVLLKSITNSYETDPFCIKLRNTEKSIDGIHWENGLLYMDDHLVIPRVGTLHEDLYIPPCT
jgi:hypothetical protein